MSRSSKLDTFLFEGESPEGRVLCPVSIREKQAGYPEVVSPYGFGGFASGQRENPLDALPACWAACCAEHGFVTAYLMQHPMYSLSEAQWGDELHGHHPLCVMDLGQSEEALWTGMGKTHRYEIRKLQQGGGQEMVRDASRLEPDLLRLYPQTVRRVGASTTYSFTEETLRLLAGSEGSLLLGVQDTAGLQAVAVFLYTPTAADYFLNAATPDGRKYTRLLVWSAMLELKRRGVAYLNLGGGVRPGDPLEQFKRRFGGRMVRGQVVQQVLDQGRYDTLRRQFCGDAGEEASFFPPYWAPSRSLVPCLRGRLSHECA